MTEHPSNSERDLERREAELWDRVRRDIETATSEAPERERLVGWLRAVNVGAPWLRVVSDGERPRERRRLGSRALRVGLLAALAGCGVVAAALYLTSGDGAVRVARLGQQSAARSTAAQQTPTVVPARSELVLSSGQVTLDGHDPVVGRTPLVVGQRIATELGRACLTADPDVALCLDEHSEIRIASLDPKSVRFEVLRGSAVAQLSPRAAGHSFTLLAGDVRARAVGTVYQVTHDVARKHAVVMVLAGKVDVSVGPESAAAAVARVPAHNRLEVDLASGGTGELETLGRVEESPVWTRLRVAEWWTRPDVGVVEVHAEDVGASAASIDDGPSLSLPVHALLPLGNHRLAVTNELGERHTTEFEVEIGQPRRVAMAAARAPSATPAGPGSPAALLDRARELRQAGHARAALSAYARVRSAFPASAEARTVLVTMGKLQLELGQPGPALSSFEAYLGAPGALTPEALGGKASALRALGNGARERAAIEEYLRRFPKGFLAPKFERRLQSLR